MNEIFLKEFNKVQRILIICEHESFRKKLFEDIPSILDKNHFVIFYRKRKITNWNFSIYLNLISTAFSKKTIVVSEYFNLIPRLISFITFSESMSILYGVLTKNNFKKKNIKLSPLFTSLYANHFYVVNRIETLQLVKKHFPHSRTTFIDLQRKVENSELGNYCLWISQCWEEDNLNEIESFQKLLINKLSNLTELIIVKHPRDHNNKYCDLRNATLTQINSIFDFVEKNGLPKYTFGFSSSALLELKDYNFRVLRFEDKNVSKFNSNNKDIGSIKLINANQIETLFRC